jgi:virginiamycin A acetyltransferase
LAEGVVVNAGVSVGDWTYANRGAIPFSGSIGHFCSIAHNAQVGPENHPLTHLSTAPCAYTASGWDEFASPPRIGSDVWIGSHATVLQGVSVGDDAVIGAGAVVTRHVQPYEIVCGVPARPLRKRFDDATIDMLLRLRWWELPASEWEEHLSPAFAAGPGWREFLPTALSFDVSKRVARHGRTRE